MEKKRYHSREGWAGSEQKRKERKGRIKAERETIRTTTCPVACYLSCCLLPV